MLSRSLLASTDPNIATKEMKKDCFSFHVNQIFNTSSIHLFYSILIISHMRLEDHSTTKSSQLHYDLQARRRLCPFASTAKISTRTLLFCLSRSVKPPGTSKLQLQIRLLIMLAGKSPNCEESCAVMCCSLTVA